MDGIVITAEELVGLWLRHRNWWNCNYDKMEHIYFYEWHLYYVAADQVMVATVQLSVISLIYILMIRYFRACVSDRDLLDEWLLITKKLLNHEFPSH